MTEKTPRLLTIPGPETDPRETLRWVRRWEIVSGIGALLLAVPLWDDGWWRWALLASGVAGLSPWPGARMILRRDERDPDVLVWDPDRRRMRARRVALTQVAVNVVVGGLVGYLMDGWLAAIFIAGFAGAIAAVVGWLLIRRERA